MAARDDEFMEIALDLASRGAAHGDVPVGAVLVVEGQTLGWGHNRRECDDDVLGHAELAALRMACNAVGDWRLPRSTLYVTLEPCIMCTGATLQARVDRIVFGCRDPKAGAVRSLFALAEDPRLPHRARITEGVLAARCQELLTRFFEQLRSQQESDKGSRSGN